MGFSAGELRCSLPPASCVSRSATAIISRTLVPWSEDPSMNRCFPIVAVLLLLCSGLACASPVHGEPARTAQEPDAAPGARNEPAEISTLDTRLIEQPAISADHVAFVYAGDLWVANLDGSNVRRLTTHPGEESRPRFSPDGKWIAFSGQYDGNTDVYIVPTTGGEP